MPQIFERDGLTFINEGRYEFKDISSEEYRVYIYPNGDELRMEGILYLAVSDSGHRLFDSEGISHYIPYGWRRIMWKAKPGCPSFVL